MPLEPHDALPLFTVTTMDGTSVPYLQIWQREHLVLLSFPREDPTGPGYADSLKDRLDSSASDTRLLVTHDIPQGVPSPGVVVADKWGEVYYVQGAARAADLPSAEALHEWVEHVRQECPECQGETK